MTSTNNTYIPDMSDWVSYYGNQTGSGTPASQMHNILGESGYEKTEAISEKNTDNLVSNSNQAAEGTPDAVCEQNSCIRCGLIDEMSTDIQVLSPVQTAVNQAMATKRRRISKKKRKSGGKKSGKVGKHSRTKKIKRKRKKTKKTQRDIFNF